MRNSRKEPPPHPDHKDARSEVIAAIATPPGTGAIAIVRVSGPASLAVADHVFSCPAPSPSQRPGHTFVHGHVLDSTGRRIDEALLLIFREPRSYTGEDSFEVHCHGGRQCAKAVLQRLVETGCRPAEPGEFTRRAFLNGRIDLVQAEAVQELIRAQSSRAAALAIEQLEGRLSLRVNRIYDAILQLAAEFEARLDFPEEDIPPAPLEQCVSSLVQIRQEAQSLLHGWGKGHIVREGARVAIVGRANAGKSTLFNALLGKDRAIVSQHPGTTRDTLEENILADGHLIRLVDTAGLRSSECEIEQEGMKRALGQMEMADVTIYTFDLEKGFTKEDEELLGSQKWNRLILAGTKSDIVPRTKPDAIDGKEVLVTSSVKEEGLAALLHAIAQILEEGTGDETSMATLVSERHQLLLRKADAALLECVQLVEEQGETSIAVVCSRIREAVECIGQITGRQYSPDLLDAIFKRFCIGK